MSDNLYLKEAISKILGSPDLVTRQNLNLENGIWDIDNLPAKIDGDITAGAAFRSSNSLLVTGDVLGSERWPVRIQTEGDVIVQGRAQFAQIEGHEIHIRGESNQCRFKARKQIAITGNLVQAHLVLGVHTPEQRNINRLTQLIKDQLSDKGYIERQLHREEKRIYNLFQTTSITLPTGLGQIIQHKRKRIAVNLQPLYEILSDRQGKDIDQALNDFFSKAIVGIFTKANKEYLKHRNNRKDIFMGALRQFRHLFTLTRQYDATVHQIQTFSTQLQDCISDLNHQKRHIFVHGKVLGNLTLNFVIPQAEYNIDGDHVFHSDLASLEMNTDPQTRKITISRTTVDQESSQDEVIDSSLQDVRFGVYEGLPIWEPIGEKIANTTEDLP